MAATPNQRVNAGRRRAQSTGVTLLLDIRHALRLLRNSPGFTLVAVLTLALGIGANTAIFSVLNGIVLSPLNFADSARIAAIGTSNTKTGRLSTRVTGGDLPDLREAPAFEAMAYYSGGEMGVQLEDRAEFTSVAFVNPDYFRVFGVAPLAGRVFSAEPDESSALIGLAFAQRNFGSAQAALGRKLSLDNKLYTVGGVLPADFAMPRKTQVWLSAPIKPRNTNRTAYNYSLVAKLKADVSPAAAQAALDAIAARLAAAYPASNRDKGFAVTPLRDTMVAGVKSTLLLLMGAVSLVLLIACANVANLLLARATARAREIALRAALGASRWRIVRQLMIESAILAIAGGSLGVLLAQFGTDALLRLAPPNLPRVADIHMDWAVLAFVTAASLSASLLFGLAPAWKVSRADLIDAIKSGGSRGALGGGGSARLRNLLVAGEIALSFVLAIGAGLLLRSFASLTTVDLGFKPDRVLVMYAHAPAKTLKDAIATSRFFATLTPRLGALPGVKIVASAMGLPAGQYGSNGGFLVEGRGSFESGIELPQAGFRLASPAYFATMGIPLIRGRDFSDRDSYEAPFAAIVSETLAKRVFPGEDPIGKRLQCGLDSPNWMTIVGIVGDVRASSPATAPDSELYMPLRQHPFMANESQFVLRTAGDPAALTTAVRETVRSANPAVAMKFTTMDSAIADSIAAPRFRAALIAAFAGLALVLAAIGIYGVMTYLVSQRTSELGLRMALGASQSGILRMILLRALVLAGVGLAAGLALSLAAARAIESMLFGIKSTDLASYVAASLGVAIVASLAAALPAWRAARIDPMTALRRE